MPVRKCCQHQYPIGDWQHWLLATLETPAPLLPKHDRQAVGRDVEDELAVFDGKCRLAPVECHAGRGLQLLSPHPCCAFLAGTVPKNSRKWGGQALVGPAPVDSQFFMQFGKLTSHIA